MTRTRPGQAAWTVPANRTKGAGASGPTGARCIELLGLAKVLSAATIHFSQRGRTRSDVEHVLLMTVRRMKSDYTAHDLRWALRDRASERTLRAAITRQMTKMANHDFLGRRTSEQ